MTPAVGDAGQRAQRRDRLLLEPRPRLALRVARPAERDARRPDAARVEARPFAEQTVEALRQQPGADEQHDAHRELRDDERAAHPLRAAPAAALPARLANRARQILAQQREHGRQTRHDGREHGGAERIRERRRVEHELEALVRAIEPERAHEREPAGRDAEPSTPPASASSSASTSTMRTRRSPPAPSAERTASSLRRDVDARQLQVREVRARDQQHDDHDRLEHHEHVCCRLADLHDRAAAAARP